MLDMRIKQSVKRRYADLTERLVIARQNHEQAKNAVEETEREIINLLESYQQKSTEAITSLGTYQLTYVRPTRVKVDEAGLRKSLGAKVYDRYTVPRLDRKKLEGALEAEEVDVNQVSPYISEEVGSPYLRITERKKESEG